MRADLLLHAAGKEVYVEIAGSRNDSEYEQNLQKKIHFAQEHGLSLVIIDMTAYPDKNGKNIMRINYQTLCRIFLYIQLGILKSGIVLPYWIFLSLIMLFLASLLRKLSNTLPIFLFVELHNS